MGTSSDMQRLLALPGANCIDACQPANSIRAPTKRCLAPASSSRFRGTSSISSSTRTRRNYRLVCARDRAGGRMPPIRPAGFITHPCVALPEGILHSPHLLRKGGGMNVESEKLSVEDWRLLAANTRFVADRITDGVSRRTLLEDIHPLRAPRRDRAGGPSPRRNIRRDTAARLPSARARLNDTA